MRSSIAGAALALAVLAGCAYVPPLSHQYNAGDLRRLVPGQTTREQAERLLRSPRRLQSSDRILVCEQRRHAGYVAMVGFGGGAVGPLVTQRYRILLAFDSTQVLQRLEVEPKRGEKGAVPGLDTTWKAFPCPSESLYVRQSWPDPSLAFVHLAASRSGLLTAVDGRGNLWAWSKQVNGPPYHVVLPRRGPVQDIALAPDGRHLACLSKDLAWVALPSWDFVPGGSNPLPAAWTVRGARAMALSADGSRLAVLDKHGALAVLDSHDGSLATSLPAAKSDPAVAVAWSPNGRAVVTLDRPRRGGYALTFHELNSPEARSVTVSSGDDPEPAAPAIAFSPDGHRIAINRGTHVELWTVAGSPSAVPPARLENAFLLPYATPAPDGSAAPLSLSFGPRTRLLAAGNGRATAYALDGSRRCWRYALPDGSTPLVRDLLVDPADGRIVGAVGRGVFGWNPPTAEVATSAP
jgi:hypothetical protein